MRTKGKQVHRGRAWGTFDLRLRKGAGEHGDESERRDDRPFAFQLDLLPESVSREKREANVAVAVSRPLSPPLLSSGLVANKL